MSFFKKLFSDNKKSEADKKPDIDSLLLNDTDKLILDLDTYLFYVNYLLMETHWRN